MKLLLHRSVTCSPGHLIPHRAHNLIPDGSGVPLGILCLPDLVPDQPAAGAALHHIPRTAESWLIQVRRHRQVRPAQLIRREY